MSIKEVVDQMSKRASLLRFLSVGELEKKARGQRMKCQGCGHALLSMLNTALQLQL